jgi:predicted RecA/RadA family phage recombinase
VATTKIKTSNITDGIITADKLHITAITDKLGFTPVDSANFASSFSTELAGKSTTDLQEGTNLYYTDTRWDTRLNSKSTDDLAEGTNLYYTDTRVGTYLSSNSFATESYVTTAISNLVDFAPESLDTLNELAAALGDDANYASTITTALGNKFNSSDFDSTFDTRLGTKSTTDLAEGTNLYYTEARWDDRLTLKTTSDLAEGTNLYYTDTKVGTYLTDNNYATQTYAQQQANDAAVAMAIALG